MSVNGLNKITDRILSDANTRAEGILADAKKDCERVALETERKIAEIRAKNAKETAEKTADLAARAKASATTQKRNLILRRQSEIVDGVFATAKRKMISADRKEYTELLADLVAASVAEQVKTEEENRKLYGDEEETTPENYEVLLSEEDRKTLGEAVVKTAKERLKGKVSEERVQKITLSDTPAKIDGGIVLRYGDVEANCSMEMLFAELRRELEGEVSKLLFGAEKS